MSQNLTIVAAAVVVIAAVVVLLVLRTRKRAESAGERPAVAAPPPEPAGGREVETEVTAGEAETPAAVTPEVVRPPPKPTISESELKAQVKSQLEDSERMLSELKQVEAKSASPDSPVDTSTVDLLEEGLREVRALADRKQWSQARDKGQALRAQLSLMLQTARRGKAS